MGSDGAYTWDGSDLVLRLKVVPGAANEEIVPDARLIRVKLHAPARDGKANKRLFRMLGKLFGVPPSAVVLERGQTSRAKRVRIHSPSRLPPFIAG